MTACILRNREGILLLHRVTRRLPAIGHMCDLDCGGYCHLVSHY